MKNIHVLLILAMFIALSSCNSNISTSLIKKYPALDYKQDVVVIGLDQQVPDNSEEIGQVKIGDTGFTVNRGYDVVLEKAKLEARKAGGNAIKIIEHRPPTIMGSSCHRITAKILKVENFDALITNEEEQILPDVDYAILHVYRYSGAGAFVGYDLFLGDTVICRVKNNFKTTIKVKKDGLNTLWARTEAKSEVPIDIKIGKEYYLRCGITMGLMVGRPSLELVDRKTGKAEFESFKAKN